MRFTLGSRNTTLTNVAVFSHKHLGAVDLVLRQHAANFSLCNLGQFAHGREGDATSRLGLWSKEEVEVGYSLLPSSFTL